MQASEIRRRFLEYFRSRGHELRPSSSLIPANDPTLLFTNAGMVQFKEVFVGAEEAPWARAVTTQKCVRAGGKHNDLEQVGETARHHTFFEMLGNFSFGDYFKRDAIQYAWGFLTEELNLDPDHLFVTVHHSDDEAFELWQEVAGVDPARIFRMGDRDNFWQMADTGPCGPCSEVHFDQRPDGERSIPDEASFEALGESGAIMELWNLVFMQYDRDAAGKLNPLPAPSIDTGAGLERLAAVLQGVDSNYHTDLFAPLLARVEEVTGVPYRADEPSGMSARVLADHARAVAFLLADGVLPSNEGRGYVLRRILRRAVRHAWLLGRREPTLVEVVDALVPAMAPAWPELEERREHLLQMTRLEEERFLQTIDGGMERLEELAPAGEPDPDGGRVIPGDEAFRLYDTFGFPIDLTQILARERGWSVDVEGFERALEEQRARSRADRARTAMDEVEGGLDSWTMVSGEVDQRWVGWEETTVETRVVALRRDGGRLGVILEENPFYVEAGGQVSDTGFVEGDEWNLEVDRVFRVEGRTAVEGRLSGDLRDGMSAVRARVERDRRHDTERNHTATHLLHAALRQVLGEHVEQRGSLVAPDRLRFDFAHGAPLTAEELESVEREVNDWIWSDHPVEWEIVDRDEALARGAMALFGEKYGDEVRVVEVPGVSLELCGGTHLRHTGEAGLFRIVREGGVASGVRRVEAVTGPEAYRRLREAEAELQALAGLLRTSREGLPDRLRQLIAERAELESILEELRRSGGGGEEIVLEERLDGDTRGDVLYRAVRLRVRDADDARAFGDAFRESEASGVLAVASEGPEERRTLFVFVTDDLIGRGVRAGDLVREIARVVGGRGGGRPHLAQGGIEDPSRIEEALRSGAEYLRSALEAST